MVEPEKPFACTMPDCGMTFTNEDHLNVHTKKHDMVLQFGCEQKAAVFVADQTPTPTRFIRNCEEVGLFQDLQNVNPFDEGFKRAIETKQGILSLEHGCTPSSEELHTPQMFPLLDGTESVFSTTNNQRCVTISRSSSDENGAVKEFETTRISKLTNEVTTISRIVEKHDDTPKTKDILQKNSVSYTNNVIKILSNVEIKKGIEDTAIKDTSVKDGVFTKDVVAKDCILTKDCTSKDVIFCPSTKDSVFCSASKDSVFCPTSKDNVFCPSAKDSYNTLLQVDVPPIMSQKSIDFVVDSLTTDYITAKTVKDAGNIVIKDVRSIKDNKNTKQEVNTNNAKKKEDYEVTLKLPSGQEIKLINAEESKQKNAKHLLKKVLTEKVESQKILNNMTVPLVPTVIPTITNGTVIPTITSGTLIPVSIVNASIANYIPKLPLKVFDKKAIKRKSSEGGTKNNGTVSDQSGTNKIIEGPDNGLNKIRQNVANDLESRSAASRRYRARLKETMTQQALENKQLKQANERLTAEKAALKAIIVEHVRRCHCEEDLRELHEKIYRVEGMH